MQLITWLDWFNTISLIPISQADLGSFPVRLERDDLLAAIHCFSPEGRLYRGARCIRRLSRSMPLALPLAILLYVPGVIWLAEKIYQWISRNRYVLSRVFRCNEACRILPAKRPKEH